MDKVKEKINKLIPLLLVAIIAISLIGGGTLAYITRESKTENVITAGEIKVKLCNMLNEEETMPPEGIYGILANVTYPNIVYAHNECDYPEYIRMKISKEITNKEGEDLDINKFTLQFNTDDWTYSKEDGYYYYNNILAPHTNSAPLYNGIHVAKDVNNKYKTATLDVHIIVEAVQADNNGTNVFEAEGWEVKDVS